MGGTARGAEVPPLEGVALVPLLSEDGFITRHTLGAPASVYFCKFEVYEDYDLDELELSAAGAGAAPCFVVFFLLRFG